MIKVIKKGIPYVLAIGVACVIMLFVNFANRYQMTPKHVYKVYLDGKSIGNIADKLELEDYINEEQSELKDKYSVDKVYIPEGVSIQSVTTYEKEVLTAKQVHNIIKDKKPFTVKGYKVTIKKTSDDDEDRIIYVLDKKIFEKSMRAVLEAFVSKDDINNYENDTQPEIKSTGSLIEDIYINQGITIKNTYISTDENIFIDEKTLTKYLLFGEIKEDQYYTVQEGDTIESIAYNNKLAVPEFLVVNPEFTSANNLLSVGQQVKVGLISPIVDVVVESHTILDQDSKYETETIYDDSMYAGVQKVESEGQNGVDRLTTKIKTINGETTNVVIVSHETITPSIKKVVRVGTKSNSVNDPIIVSDGSWAWPTISQYFISSYFGYRWGKFHEAVDIAGSGEGSPIFAAGSGNVVTAKRNAPSLGNYVVINHNNGYYTIYAHMSSLTVTQGQAVQKGQQVGTMGHTGFATGTHLHFGLYKNGMPYRDGIPLNPLILYK